MLKKSIALFIFALALFAFTGSLKAQEMYFCESVSSDGYPSGESSTFNISSAGGYLDVLVKLPYDVNCSSVRFEIYYNGDYSTTIYLDTQANWVWFYKQITFYKSGSYQIYCIDCNDITLASGTLRTQFQ